MTEIAVAVVLGLIEGITEFIPVSSTGHLIVAGYLLGFEGQRAATFQIFIQIGAILAVVLLYRERFMRLLPTERGRGFAGMRGLLLLAITSVPAGLLGLVTHDFIEERLFNPTAVAIGLALGGVALILVERRVGGGERTGLDAITWRDALIVGLFQSLSLWPGASRAAATIIGGRLVGLERQTAAEYSFFAAVPVLLAAGFYALLTNLESLQPGDIPMFAVGLLVAFASALLAVKSFVRFVGTHTLAPIGWYRLVLAAVVLLVLR